MGIKAEDNFDLINNRLTHIDKTDDRLLLVNNSLTISIKYKHIPSRIPPLQPNCPELNFVYGGQRHVLCLSLARFQFGNYFLI